MGVTRTKKATGLACENSLLTSVVFVEILNVWCQWEEKRELHLDGHALPSYATHSSFHSATIHHQFLCARCRAGHSSHGEQKRQDPSPTELASSGGTKHQVNVVNKEIIKSHDWCLG